MVHPHRVDFVLSCVSSLFLDQKVNVVDTEGSELLDRTLQGHEQATIRDVSVTVDMLVDYCRTQT